MKTLELGQRITLNQKGKTFDFIVKDIENGTYKLFNKFFLSRFWTLEEINSNLA